MFRKTLVFLFMIVSSFSSFAQDKVSLENQRNQIKEEIKRTQDLLNETSKTEKVSVRQLALINRKVKLQEGVVSNIRKEIRELSDNIYLSQLEINRMNRVLDTLKDEYATSMVYAYKNRGNYSFLSFVFASESFNDAIKRIAYLKSYRDYRKVQAENIIKTQTLMEAKVNQLEDSKKRKSSVLNEQGDERNKLEKQRIEQATVVSQLRGKKKELSALIAARKKEDAKLKNAISAMVKREIARAKAEAERKEKERLAALKKEKEKSSAGASGRGSVAEASSAAVANVGRTSSKSFSVPDNSVLVNTVAEADLNAGFESNRGKLPWPVNGFILYQFGNNSLPGGVSYYNYGVTLGCRLGENVKAVFEGEVTLVSYIEDNQAVYIKHGQYFTVYSNLTNVSVKKGSHVQTGQIIGHAGENDEGEGGRVEFLLLKESDYQNPQTWLK